MRKPSFHSPLNSGLREHYLATKKPLSAIQTWFVFTTGNIDNHVILTVKRGQYHWYSRFDIRGQPGSLRGTGIQPPVGGYNLKMLRPLSMTGAMFAVAYVSASTYFLEPFNTNPVLSPTQAAGVWYTDRYAPANFDAYNPGDGNHLRIGISAADGLTGRPGPYQSTFYNTQGRKFDLGNGFYTSLKAKLYVANDWSNNLRRSDMWGTMVDGTNAVTAYPIIGFANIDRTAIVCRVWTNAGWQNVSAQVPGGITTNRWYNLEIRLKPGAFEFLVDNKVVYTDADTGGGVSFSNVIMQAYNFNDDPSLPVPTTGESYAAYWDDLSAGPISMDGYPVDLNGSYRSPSSGALNPLVNSASGIGVAATIPIGFGQAFERNGVNAVVDNAVNGTFTPYNDTTKVPNALFLANANDANGTAFDADVDLSGTWKPFQWGQGIGNVPPFATGDTFALGLINSFNSFGVQIVTNGSGQYVARIASNKLSTGSIAALETNGTPATFPAGTTRVRLSGQVIGGLFTATATPLDGPAAMTVYPLGSTNGTNMNTNFPWALTYDNMGFVAGFETHEHVAAGANATVSNFTTDAIGNAMYLFADDPYVRTVDGAIDYRLGQANLLQTVSGFQAFMNNGAGQTFATASYAGPYTTFNPPTINAALDAAGAAVTDNQANVTDANIRFTPGAGETATGMGFRPNTGNEVNLFAGGAPNYLDINATTSGSNTVLIDNTAPTLTAPTLGGSAYSAPNVVVGTLTITANATDLGAQQSGLAGRPTGVITWSDASTTSVSTISVTGNTFQASLPITNSTPNGTATLVLSVTDRAGNTSTQTITFNVSTVNVVVTLTEKGVTSTVSRVIEISVGSTGGANAPITVRKLVNFNTPVNLPGPIPSMQGSVLVTYQDLDLADDSIANNSVTPSAAITQVYAKDPFFSLGKKENLVGSLGSYSASVILTMGDLTNNNVVNVSDLAVWAANNGSTQNPNTTLAQPAVPRQANVDGGGTVNLADRNLVIAAWLFSGDSFVGNFRGDPGNGAQTIAQVFFETGLGKDIVRSMDLDKDGWITREEILRWKNPAGPR